MTRIHRPERLARMPDAVLFDTDNTLYPYDPSHHRAMEAVRSKVVRSMSISEATFDSAFAAARTEIKQRLKGTAASHNRLLYFQRMLELIGLGSQVLVALDLEQTYWRTFLSVAELFEGLKEFLDDLRLAGVPTAIVTDLTAQIQFRKIVYFGLDQYFDHIVTSEEAGFDKPNPGPFELAIQKMKVSSDAIVWMIGDNQAADIAGARRAISAVTLQKLHAGVTEGTGEEQPDMSFEHFDQLRLLIKRLQPVQDQGMKTHA
ncbi:MAG: HAD family hydrolase [Variovorax sp.]|nr:HAD family hydrolase [Variovorax sp.]